MEEEAQRKPNGGIVKTTRYKTWRGVYTQDTKLRTNRIHHHHDISVRREIAYAATALTWT